MLTTRSSSPASATLPAIFEDVNHTLKGDAPKMVGFRGSAFRGAGPRFEDMGMAIDFVASKAKAAAAKAKTP
jgi:hypothetical protein